MFAYIFVIPLVLFIGGMIYYVIRQAVEAHAIRRVDNTTKRKVDVRRVEVDVDGQKKMKKVRG